MNNQQPAYGVNYSGYGVTQSSSQPMYNQAIHYNQGVYNSKMFPQQAHQSQAAYNLPVAQSYGQVQYGGGYQQANPFIRMWIKIFNRIYDKRVILKMNLKD